MVLLVLDLLQAPAPGRLPRGVSGAMRAAHTEVAEYWQETILPQHFKPHARHKYGHKPRARSTKARKARKGRYIDNVDKGLAKSIALSYRPVKAFPSRAAVKIPGPSYFTMRRRDSRKVHPVTEMLTMVDAERRRLQHIAGESFDKHLAEHARRSRRRTRAS